METQSTKDKVLVENEAQAGGGIVDMRETRSRQNRNTLFDPGHFSALSATPAATFPPCLVAPTHVAAACLGMACAPVPARLQEHIGRMCTHTCRVNIPVYASVSTHAGKGHANTSLASAEQ